MRSVRAATGSALMAGPVCLVLVASCLACDKTFNGDQFLKSAGSKGIAARSTPDCDTVNLASNAFYAPPKGPCTLKLSNATWLAQGFRFKNLEGEGAFTVEATKDGLDVTISKEKGFRLVSVTISTSEKDCEKLKIDAVLR